jgi:non-canonical poly(A) RNA polymerase PAPD5/7
MQIDISIQDQKHYGLRCVELVRTFLKDYEVLEPIVLALKNILKLASLNDPYTGGLSSYGLILMVVSFLQVKIYVK